MNDVLQLRLGSTTAVLRGKEIVVGRSVYCSLIINDATVSRVHATLTLHGGLLEARDMGSKNGTFVNGRRVGNAPVAFRVGDALRFGDVICKVEVATVPTGQGAATQRPSRRDEDPEDTTASLSRPAPKL